jgi:hypothetical protein
MVSTTRLKMDLQTAKGLQSVGQLLRRMLLRIDISCSLQTACQRTAVDRLYFKDRLEAYPTFLTLHKKQR